MHEPDTHELAAVSGGAACVYQGASYSKGAITKQEGHTMVCSGDDQGTWTPYGPNP